MLSANQKSLQRGFGFGGLDGDGRLAWVDEHQSVREVIWNILLTRPGERLMRPEFGAGLRDYLHQPNNETTRRLIADVATHAIRRFEPRIQLLELRVSADPLQLSQVVVAIRYRLVATGQQQSMELALALQG